MDLNVDPPTELFRAVMFVGSHKLYSNACVDEYTATVYRDIMRAAGRVAWVERTELTWKEI